MQLRQLALLLLVLWGALGRTATQVPPVPQVYVVLSPYYDAPARAAAHASVLQLINAAPAGTTLLFLDGWNLVPIAKAEFPADMMDALPQRRRAARGAIVRIEKFFHDLEAAPGCDLSGSAAIDFPRALRLAIGQPAASARSVLVLGSPLQQSPTEPQLSFPPDRYPSDAHLFVEPAYSNFSVHGAREHLKHVQVFVRYPSERIFGTALYRECVARFFNLFLSFQQGVLAEFGVNSADSPAGLFAAGAQPVRQDSIDPTLRKVEMLSVKRTIDHREIVLKPKEVIYTPVPTRPAAPAAPEGASAAEQRVRAEIQATPRSQTSAGILWSIGGLDLDLYGYQRADVPSGPLNYRNTHTPEGVYVHDYTDRNDGEGYEKIIFHRPPTSLNAMQLFVNLYSGSSSTPVTGKVYVSHQGVLYKGTFHLRARDGNRGDGIDQRRSSPHWTEIRVDGLVREPDPAQDGLQ